MYWPHTAHGSAAPLPGSRTGLRIIIQSIICRMTWMWVFHILIGHERGRPRHLVELHGCCSVCENVRPNIYMNEESFWKDVQWGNRRRNTKCVHLFLHDATARMDLACVSYNPERAFSHAGYTEKNKRTKQTYPICRTVRGIFQSWGVHVTRNKEKTSDPIFGLVNQLLFWILICFLCKCISDEMK